MHVLHRVGDIVWVNFRPTKEFHLATAVKPAGSGCVQLVLLAMRP